MATTIARKGYGQVQPNHLSGIVTGQIYAQLPAATESSGTLTAINQLEQGQFLKYDYAKGCADYAGDGEWMLVYCEQKLYDERKQHHKDFVLKKTDFTDGYIYPRLIKTNIGDIYTTNMFGAANTGTDATVGTSVTLSVGNYLQPADATGILTLAASSGTPVSSLSGLTGMVWQVVKEYTMPDGTPGVKIQRVQ